MGWEQYLGVLDEIWSEREQYEQYGIVFEDKDKITLHEMFQKVCAKTDELEDM